MKDIHIRSKVKWICVRKYKKMKKVKEIRINLENGRGKNSSCINIQSLTKMNQNPASTTCMNILEL